MRIIFQIVSWIALAGTILPSVLFLSGLTTLDQVKQEMFVAAIVWFIATPLWMGHNEEDRRPRAEAQEQIV